VLRNTLLSLIVACCATTAAAAPSDVLLDDVQRRAFDYFWNEANPANGLIKDRSTPGSPCSIAAVGFGLSAICIGIDHGWVSREDGRARILTTLNTFWDGPQGSGSNGFIGYKGLFYHFLDMTTAVRTWSCELSTIDTALLFAGIIDAKHYFTTADPLDVEVRTLADNLIDRADWEFMRASGPGVRMGWKPEGGFGSFGTWVGYNEAMILYVLALGSATHPVPANTWFTWTSGYDWLTQYGYTYVNFPPLFGHQYSHCWIDFRNIQDIYMRSKGIDYFENSRRATLAQQAYCIENPSGFTGYGEFIWGLTACDDPFGYSAHGAPPAQNDNGTIAPTAPAGSIVFAPEIVIPTLNALYDIYGSSIWSTYGFKDAFNPTFSWVGTDYLGIDQGPIVLMIENYLNGRVWARMMQDDDIQRGLDRAGFEPVLEVDPAPPMPQVVTLAPNPFGRVARLSYRLDAAGDVLLRLYDVQGRPIRSVAFGEQPAGAHAIDIDAAGLPNGVYYYEVQAGEGPRLRNRFTVLR